MSVNDPVLCSLDDIGFLLDSENEPFCGGPPKQCATAANVFREPSRLEIDISKIRSKVTDTSTERGKVKAVRRKFPGPAGLLPDKPPRSFSDPVPIPNYPDTDQTPRKEDSYFCSQASEEIFNEPLYKKLTNDFGLNKPDSPLSTFTVDWVKKKALGKGLKSRKIPFLAVILQSIDYTLTDPLVTLRDPTGQLLGALHREAWKEMAGQLHSGVAIVLREVGVLSTGVTKRQVILNMTKNNILSVYSCTEDGEVITNTLQPTTTTEILQSVSDWHARAASIVKPAKAAAEKRSCLFLQYPETSSTSNTVIHQNKSKPPRDPSESESNFDFFDDNFDFSSVPEEEDSQSVKKPKSGGQTCNNPPPSCSQVLSQAEASMLDADDELFSSVDFDSV